MNVLDKQLRGNISTVPISSDSVEQATHSASPTTYGFKHNAVTLTITVAAFYFVVYILHVLERVVRK